MEYLNDAGEDLWDSAVTGGRVSVVILSDRYRFTRHAAYFNSTGCALRQQGAAPLDCAWPDPL